MRPIVNLVNLWRDHLVRFVPAALIHPGLRRNWQKAMVLDASFATDPSTALAKIKNRVGAQPIDLKLPQKAFLRRKIVLPKMNRRNTDAALELNLQSSVPVPSDQLLWRNFKASETDKNQNHYQYIIRKNRLEGIVSAFHDHGLNLRTIGISGVDGIPLLVDQRRKTDAAFRAWWGLAALVILSAISFKVGSDLKEISELRNLADDMEASANELRADVYQALKERSQEQNSLASQADAARAMNAQRLQLSLLNDLTTQLPQDAWISEFDLVDSVLRIGGFASGDIATMLRDLEQSNSISSARLEGALSQTQGDGARRFNVVLNLENNE